MTVLDLTQTSAPKAIRLADYQPPAFLVDTIDLVFDLEETATRVASRLQVRRNPAGATDNRFTLNGEKMRLLRVAIDGTELSPTDYELNEELLILRAPADHFIVEIETEINPLENTELEGLYLSNGNYCTQCEAEGFRKITYFPDRPDVMARFTTTIRADRAKCPVLLSNGNPAAQGELEDGRHWARWEDPHKKPCYLFALVAGDLAWQEDSFTTRSGREVTLRIYTEKKNIDRCDHAMASLKKSMRWDEEVFGLEYDLDIYMIVAVDDFNMGAMENKGLNVFNSKYVLARPDTATDNDYENIEGVIAHEYFHNWTGNRVTCRDWFQLSLKEGLTVFRDQEFSADMGSRAVQRIQDVRALRTSQFPEDAGPMAHPVRPDSYIEISNFYTATVYNKGAEVIRMQHALLGPADFRRGMDLYFSRHDGQAVTTDDFVQAMEDASGIDLQQFRRWYTQAGTPHVAAHWHHDADEKVFSLTLKQSCAPSPGQSDKAEYHIPVAFGLIGRDGKELTSADPRTGEQVTQCVLHLTAREQEFRFEDIGTQAVPSLFRGFSAPVKVEANYSDVELALLIAHDSDPFNRWEAGQSLAVRIMLKAVRSGSETALPSAESAQLEEAFRTALSRPHEDIAFLAQLLVLPSEGYVSEFMDVVDVEGIHDARRHLLRALGRHLGGDLHAAYERHAPDEAYRFAADQVARRALRASCLQCLVGGGEDQAIELARAHYFSANNMTDAIAALQALALSASAVRDEALQHFYEKWKDDSLVLDKWFTLQATSPSPGTIERVRELISHPAFSIRNPNKVYALVGAFARGNPRWFHDASGRGYALLADVVLELDRLNPQVAARMLTPLTSWRRYDTHRQALIEAEFNRILAAPGLSKDVYEIASKSML